jgi:hypothetical protein
MVMVLVVNLVVDIDGDGNGTWPARSDVWVSAPSKLGDPVHVAVAVNIHDDDHA